MMRILTLFALLLSTSLHAQTYKMYKTDNIHNQLRLNTKTGEVYQIQDDGQKFLVHPETTPSNEQDNRYALFKTQNIWTFILLDTFTGKLWQCQFSAQDVKNILSVAINSEWLSYTYKSKFTIQPMTSMFQFYLLDEETGEMWQFQWSTKGDDYRWIKKI